MIGDMGLLCIPAINPKTGVRRHIVGPIDTAQNYWGYHNHAMSHQAHEHGSSGRRTSRSETIASLLCVAATIVLALVAMADHDAARSSVVATQTTAGEGAVARPPASRGEELRAGDVPRDYRPGDPC